MSNNANDTTAQDFPDIRSLYRTHESEGTSDLVDVFYHPGDDPPVQLCRALSERMAGLIAHSLNATIDLTAYDVADLLDAWEQLHGSRHPGDWRTEDDA